MSAPEPNAPRRRVLRDLFRAWFDMTTDEQHAVLVVTGLLLLGVAARFWHALF